MKEEHKKIIEDVILEFKKDPNGKMYTHTFARILEDHNLRLLISKILIDDLDFIEKVNIQFLLLKKKGWDFTSFKDIESKELSKEFKDKLEIELAKSNLEANKLNIEISERNLKSEKFNKRMSIFNFIFVILNFGILIWQIIKSAK